MFSRLTAVFRIPELRQKIILTLILLSVYRMGYTLPLPFVDQDQLNETVKRLGGDQDSLGQVMQVVALFSASKLGNATIFGLGIMPYISASIIFQLLATVYPPLEALQKDGEVGRKKINEWTRYATVVICIGQSAFWVGTLSGSTLGQSMVLDEYNHWPYLVVATITMTAGTIFLMWIGEQIDEYGIGNGISLLIMAGIMARMPEAGWTLLRPAIKDGNFDISLGSEAGIDKMLLMAALFLVVVLTVIATTQCQRRIPIQSAKHVRGRRVMGGQRQSLPLRINVSGVMPIIFASSLLLIPSFLVSTLNRSFPNVWAINQLQGMFGMGERGFTYNVLYISLIYFFCYFWTGIMFNPKEMAENLKEQGAFVPGYRPGQRTAEHFDQVMNRITYVGAAFLALIAVIPTVLAMSMDVSYLVASFYGGTGLLIVVSVALDLVQKIDSHLLMRNKRGLLEAEEAT